LFENMNDLFHVIYHFCLSHYRTIFHLLGNNKWIIMEEIIITSNFPKLEFHAELYVGDYT